MESALFDSINFGYKKFGRKLCVLHMYGFFPHHYSVCIECSNYTHNICNVRIVSNLYLRGKHNGYMQML